jgi:hypothetical protein
MTTQRRSDDGLFVAEDGHGALTLWRPGDPPQYVPHDETMRVLERALAELERLTADRDTMIRRVNEARDETWLQRQRADRAEAKIEKVRDLAMSKSLACVDTHGTHHGWPQIPAETVLRLLGEKCGRQECSQLWGHGGPHDAAALAEPSQRDREAAGETCPVVADAILRCLGAGHDVGMRHEDGSLYSGTCHDCDTRYVRPGPRRAADEEPGHAE